MQKDHLFFLTVIMALFFMGSCSRIKEQESSGVGEIKLIVLDPEHPHAALVQRTMYPGIDSVVHVYAPEGLGLTAYLNYIKKYNSRAKNQTCWIEKVYTGDDYLHKMLSEKEGNVVVLAGNNQKKIDYIKRSVEAGINVLADKPMVINKAGFSLLKQAFADAKRNGVILYDIMPERSLMISILQKALAHMPSVFGEMKRGTADSPAVKMKSVHRYFKHIIRPDWFFDPNREGGAIVDVGTHLVDLVQWICFPGTVLHYEKDVSIQSCRIWPTSLTLSQFSNITGKDHFPDFLQQYVTDDSLLLAHGNGVINYTLKGVHVRVTALWTYDAPEGAGDTYSVLLRGTKASLERRQGKEEAYHSTLYVWPAEEVKDRKKYSRELKKAIEKINENYPGVSLVKYQDKSGKDGWKVLYKGGHKIHPNQVEGYLQYLRKGELPEWESAGMITKYYITTTALEIASKLKNK